MRYCPLCRITYTDQDIMFCLEDGTRLLDYSVETSAMPTQTFDEKETVVRQNRPPSDWGRSQVTLAATPPSPPPLEKSNSLLAALLAAALIVVLFGAIAGLWAFLKDDNGVGKTISGNYNVANDTSKFPSPSPPIISKKSTGWEPIDNRASLEGTNLTYYRGTTAEKCQADCDVNPKCKAFTLIRAGAYNPNDPPMCYLAAEVTGSVPSDCCISGIKSGSSDSLNRINTAETRKACDYFLSARLYEKWRQTGGRDGGLGCPTMNETEAEQSPQGTNGRQTRFGKGDGGFIILHESGKFNGTAFEVSGCMFKLYADLGGTESWLGFPIQDEVSNFAGARQDFENGYILWDSKTYDCQAFKN